MPAKYKYETNAIKKTLHKKHKQWIVISTAFMGLVGIGMNFHTAKADVNFNANNQSNNQTNNNQNSNAANLQNSSATSITISPSNNSYTNTQSSQSSQNQSLADSSTNTSKPAKNTAVVSASDEFGTQSKATTKKTKATSPTEKRYGVAKYYDSYDKKHHVKANQAYLTKPVQNQKIKFNNRIHGHFINQLKTKNGKVTGTTKVNGKTVNFKTDLKNVDSVHITHGEIKAKLNRTTNFKIKTLKPTHQFENLDLSGEQTAVKKNTVLNVKRMRVIDQIPRFELLDGTFITTNRNKVRLINPFATAEQSDTKYQTSLNAANSQAVIDSINKLQSIDKNRAASLTTSLAISQYNSAVQSIANSQANAKSVSLTSSGTSVNNSSTSNSNATSSNANNLSSVSVTSTTASSTNVNADSIAASVKAKSIAESLAESQTASAAKAIAQSNAESVANSIRYASINASLADSQSAEKSQFIASSQSASVAKSLADSIAVSNASSIAFSQSVSIQNSISNSIVQSQSIMSSQSASIMQSLATSQSAAIQAAYDQAIYSLQYKSSVAALQSQIAQNVQPAVTITPSNNNSTDTSSASIAQSIAASNSAVIASSIATSNQISLNAEQSATDSKHLNIVASLLASASASVIASQSASVVASNQAIIDQSIAASTSASIATSNSIQASLSASQSNSIIASQAASQSAELAASQHASLENSLLASTALSNSIAQSIAASQSASTAQSTANSIQDAINNSIAQSNSIQQSLAQSASVSAMESTNASIAKSISDSIAQSTASSVAASQSASIVQSIADSTAQSIADSQSESTAQSIAASQSTADSLSAAQSIQASQAAASIQAGLSEQASKAAQAAADSQSAYLASSTAASQADSIAKSEAIQASISAAQSASSYINSWTASSVAASTSASIAASESASTASSIAASQSASTAQSIADSIAYSKANTFSNQLAVTNLTLSKARYNPGETVPITYTLQNNDSNTQSKNHVSIKVFKDDQQVGDGFDSDEVVQAGQSNNLTFNWTAPSTDYQGYRVEAWIDGKAQRIAAIDVSSDINKFPRYGTITTFNPGDDNSANLEIMKNLNINALQYYDAYDTPQEPLPTNNMLGTFQQTWATWLSSAGQTKSGQVIKDTVDKAHELGMDSMFYNMIYAITGNANDPNYLASIGVKPTWILHNASDNSLFQNYMNGPNDAAATQTYLDITNPEVADWIVSKMAPVLQYMDFDGWHGDTIGNNSLMNVLDANGNIVKQYHVADELGNFANMIKARLGNKKFVINTVSFDGEDKVAKSNTDFDYSEQWDGTYYDIDQKIKYVDYLSGKSLVVPGYLQKGYADGHVGQDFNENAVLLFDAIVYAAGGSRLESVDGDNMLVKEFFPNRELNVSDDLKKQFYNYQTFITAYENHLRDGQTDNNNTIDLFDSNGNELAHSKNATPNTVYAYSRSSSTNGDTVQLINMLGVTSANWQDPDGSRQEPTAQKNFYVHYYPGSQYQPGNSNEIHTVLLASPDGDNPNASVGLNFSWKTDGNGSKYMDIQVPFLYRWDMLYFK